MTGRGIDQALPHGGDPRLHEPHVKSAERYVELAEERNGPIPRPVDFSYPWGAALRELERFDPDARVVNLETAVTAHGTPARGKRIHYRMHPGNVRCLSAAGIDCCVLANNHVLDWGADGLGETLDTLDEAGLRRAGAGRSPREARAPAVVPIGPEGDETGRRILVFAFGSTASGIPRRWGATDERAGVSLLPDLSDRTARDVAARIRDTRREGDVVVASIHWGGNWGYDVPERQRRFARLLVAEGGVDVVHGHSSHHPKGMEVFEGRPILYGCGDFLNDYEGIGGHGQFRPDLVLMYFVTLGAEDGSAGVEMRPLRIRRFRLERVDDEDARWLRDTLTRVGRPLGSRVGLRGDGTLVLRGDAARR